MAYYLEQHPPKKRQFRARRRTVRPVIVLHTAESGLDLEGQDTRAENVASFIAGRSTYGSYHTLTDRDSVVRLVRFSNAAFGDRTGSNEWAVHISIAMNANAWPTLPPHIRDQYLDQLLVAVNEAAAWFERHGHGRPKAVKLTKAESDHSGASGFIGHGDRDPGRRSDPGKGFPWGLFLARYAGKAVTAPAPTTPSSSAVRRLQAVLRVRQTGAFDAPTVSALEGKWLGNPKSFGAEVGRSLNNDPDLVKWAQTQLRRYDKNLKVDGDYGPKTEGVVSRHLRKGGIIDLGLYRWLAKLP